MNSFVYYQSGVNDSIEGTMQITDLPLVMLNPFIPDDMASLKGKLLGEMNISGIYAIGFGKYVRYGGQYDIEV